MVPQTLVPPPDWETRYRLTWREVDREAQRNGTSFFIQCKRMGLDPLRMLQQKWHELVKK